MNSLQYLDSKVKPGSAFRLDSEERAMLESNPRAESSPVRGSALSVLPTDPLLGKKAINSPVPDSENSNSYLTRYSDRHISASSSQRRIASAFAAAGRQSKAESYLTCGEQMFTLECEKCGYSHKVSYNCKLRLCSRCSAIKVAAHMKKYLPYVKRLAAVPNYLRRLDLTLKNVEDLAEGVHRIRDCFTKLRHRQGYSVCFDGGICGIEGVPGRDGKWNVHMHILYCGSFIPDRQLSADWRDITGDSFIVHIEKVSDPEKALRYVLKYLLKGVESAHGWTENELVEFVLALENVRLVQAFGCFIGKVAVVEPFRCPECGWTLWRLLDLEGETVRSALGVLLREYRDLLKLPFLFPKLTRAA